jgi:predicted nucleotidyltransferase component of viral defense system
MSSKSKGTSVTQKLIGVQQKIGVPFQNVVTAFLIERLVARLTADEHLRSALVFKGGFVSLKVYQSPRYTVDLDALLLKADLDKTLETARLSAEKDLDDGVWFHFEEQVDLATQGEYGGIRQSYRAGIGERLRIVRKAQVIHFDLGIGDPVTPAPVATKTPTLLSGEELSWSVYPVETMIAEKLHALVARGEANSRSKDIYDLHLFLPKADAKTLRTALKRCFAHRQTELPESISTLLSELNTKILERGWANAVASVPNAPKFAVAFEVLKAQLVAIEKAFR